MTFELLGLTSSATTEEVKKAWRQLATIHHPDKGGDAEKFNELRQAYTRCLELSQLNDERESQCLVCGGDGRVPTQRISFQSAFRIMCPTCRGSGKRR